MRAQIAILVLLCICTAGCDAGWQHFDMVELGQPFEGWADGVESATSAPGTVFAWTDLAVSDIPRIVAWHAIDARLDERGIVRARGYEAYAHGDWGVLKTVAYRRVRESILPEDFPADAPRGYLGDLLEAPQDRPQLSDEVGDELLTQVAIGIILYATGELCHRASRTENLAEDLTKPGYDRIWLGLAGTSLRIQNIGDRRVRVELKCFTVSDPLYATWFVTGAMIMAAMR